MSANSTPEKPVFFVEEQGSDWCPGIGVVRPFQLRGILDFEADCSRWLV